jgi:hypothetical protein
MNKILEKNMDCSILKEHKRGMRRYFPLTSTDLHSDEMATEVVSIFTGKEVTDLFKIRASYVSNCLDKYVEQFDGRFWVRTIYSL